MKTMRLLLAFIAFLAVAAPAAAQLSPLTCASECPEDPKCRGFEYNFDKNPFQEGDNNGPAKTLCERWHHAHWDSSNHVMKLYNAVDWTRGVNDTNECAPNITTNCYDTSVGEGKSCTFQAQTSGPKTCKLSDCGYCSAGTKAGGPSGAPTCSSARAFASFVITEKKFPGVKRGAQVDFTIPRHLDEARGEHVTLYVIAHERLHLGYQLAIFRYAPDHATYPNKYYMEIAQTYDGITSVSDGSNGAVPGGPATRDCQSNPGQIGCPYRTDSPWLMKVPYYKNAALFTKGTGEPGSTSGPPGTPGVHSSSVWGDTIFEWPTDNNGVVRPAFDLTPITASYTLTLRMEPDLTVSGKPRMKLTATIYNPTLGWCGASCHTLTLSNSFEVLDQNPRGHFPPWTMRNDDGATVVTQPPGPPVWAYRYNGKQQSAQRMAFGIQFSKGAGSPATFDNFSGYACKRKKGDFPQWKNPFATPTPSRTPIPSPTLAP